MPTLIFDSLSKIFSFARAHVTVFRLPFSITQFQFPVQSTTIVFYLEMIVPGQKPVYARIETRDQAKIKYNNAIQNGQLASLLEENTYTSDILKLYVGNIPPRKSAIIKIRMADTLFQYKSINKFIFTYTIPTSLFSRYRMTENLSEESESLSGDLAKPDPDLYRQTFTNKISYNVDFTLVVSDPKFFTPTKNSFGDVSKIFTLDSRLKENLNFEKIRALTSYNLLADQAVLKFSNSKLVFSKDGDISINLVKKSEYDEAQYKNLGKPVGISLNSDFEKSVILPAVQEQNLTLFNQITKATTPAINLRSAVKNLSPENYFEVDVILKSTVLINQGALKYLPSHVTRSENEYIFIVDCSGSMAGQRIKDSQSMLKLLLNSLPRGSYFNIIKFGTQHKNLFYDTQAYDENSKQQAIFMINNLEADCGGTELLPALEETFLMPKILENQPRNIFILTDGAIENTQEAILKVQEQAENNRFFTFGIGAGASTALVNGIAEAGNGYASFIHEYANPLLETYFTDESLSQIIVKALLMATQSQVFAQPKFCVSQIFDQKSYEACSEKILGMPNVLVEGDVLNLLTQVSTFAKKSENSDSDSEIDLNLKIYSGPTLMTVVSKNRNLKFLKAN